MKSSNEVPGITSESKERAINEHSYMVVSRKYTKPNWQNSTQVFSTNSCLLQKLFTKFQVTFKSILRKHGFIIKTCALFWLNLYVHALAAFFWDEESVPGRINANLRSKIKDANRCVKYSTKLIPKSLHIQRKILFLNKRK